jgi:hypothetical protein
MGWSHCHREGDWGYLGRPLFGFRWNSRIPEYSTEIAAAWDVVERLKHLEPEMRWHDENHGWYLNFSKKDLEGIPYAETAPHAICLAALKAVEMPK